MDRCSGTGCKGVTYMRDVKPDLPTIAEPETVAAVVSELDQLADEILSVARSIRNRVSGIPPADEGVPPSTEESLLDTVSRVRTTLNRAHDVLNDSKRALGAK